MIIIEQSIENAISPVMNPTINMTTHLLMLIFSRSCVKKNNNNNRKDTALLERPINQPCSVGPEAGGAGGDTWVNFCWVCAAGLLEPLPHYSLFCGHL